MTEVHLMPDECLPQLLRVAKESVMNKHIRLLYPRKQHVYCGITELCADHPNLAEYIHQMENEIAQLKANKG